MTIKRALLIGLTILVVIRLLMSLVGSFNLPQVQSRLELYQSEIILQASAYKTDDEGLLKTRDSLLGKDIYAKVEKQYKKALQETQDNYKLISQSTVTVNESLGKLDDLADEIKLKVGILQAKQGEIDKAVATWKDLSLNSRKAETAQILTDLWQNEAKLAPETETTLRDNLSNWFEYTALEQFYQPSNNQAQLAQLQAEEQGMASKGVLKLFLIAATPFIGVIVGIVLLVVLLIEWWKKGKQALLSPDSGYRWEVPWDGEIIWQVLIVGFFFASQYVLPLLFSLSGLDPSGLDIRGKALYVLVSYVTMAGVGLLVLYLSIRSFRPFPEHWFPFQWGGNWIIWGFGGYLVAFPLVLLVSLLNQQLWQGQGGSNPLILLALESKDTLALLIFFVTAAIAAPLFEEIIFRGFLLASLTRYFSTWGAIVLSSLVFSIAHLSLSEVLPLTVLGMILGFVYSRSRNLLAPILLHSLWNSGTLMSLFVLGS
ncbi:type II CAAX prenyl endopeptidase Rce1 family protein [Gloeocapsa sp. PCC 73106]|uniref:CPBP family glutamic-type intramembrane protease n=1 Tax=Gloeocapsa sp. PCC 73106 TaxID=102232 RepID=UPI0002ACBCE8|nr:CPBP family glutamic-type intramembrane protease [Gloeocapsa sp. PCC 73106]ELR96955.1 putative metal-dependent membrane protease [Gloeocapsa sp. PCC 73106]